MFLTYIKYSIHSIKCFVRNIKCFIRSINCFQRSCISSTVLHSKKEVPTNVLHFRSATSTIPSCPSLTTHSTISKRCIPIVLTNKFIIICFFL